MKEAWDFSAPGSSDRANEKRLSYGPEAWDYPLSEWNLDLRVEGFGKPVYGSLKTV